MTDYIVFGFLTNPPSIPSNAGDRFIVKPDTDSVNNFHSKANHVIMADFSNPSYPKWKWSKPEYGDTATIITQVGDTKNESFYIFKTDWDLQYNRNIV